MNRFFAIVFLSIFLFVQAGPALNAVYSGTATVLIMDEDKQPEKTKDGQEKKDSKLCDPSFSTWFFCVPSTGIGVQSNESIISSPFLEIPGLPPDIA